MRRLKTVRWPPIYPKTPGHLPCSSLTHPLPLSSRRPSVSFGGFGLKGSLISWRALNLGVDVSRTDTPRLQQKLTQELDVASWSWKLAGVAVFAALLPGVAVGTGSGVSGGSAAGVTGLGSDVAAPAEAGTVAIAPPGVGVCSPQASRAARITRAVHSGIFSIHLPLDSSLVLT